MLVYKFPSFFTTVNTPKCGLCKFKVGHEDVNYHGPNVYENLNINFADCVSKSNLYGLHVFQGFSYMLQTYKVLSITKNSYAPPVTFCSSVSETSPQVL